jgi:hypothetical protein
VDYNGNPGTLLCANPSRGYHALPGFPFVAQHIFERNIRAEIFLVGGRGNQRIAMSSDLIRDR